ncbi:MAG: carbamate kinase [Clostridiaceae bacterium]|jgi:carbamate kinase|nr:carbamate kinase [Clostridiaceae bacterium]
MNKTIVIALGGNAILKKGESGTKEQQESNIRETCRQLIWFIQQGYRIVITHGNGPQVGNIILQNEIASKAVPAMPFDVCGAESQGFLGYIFQQSLFNAMKDALIDKPVATIVTQVVVNAKDPAFEEPTKPIGGFKTEKEAKEIMSQKPEETWREDAGRGWRRVVPSPKPLRIVELKMIKTLLENNYIVIASGGGGIPVVEEGKHLRPVSAVIDKDLAAAKLAEGLGADFLMILTDVDRVAINFNQPDEEWLEYMDLKLADRYLSEGHFKKGSMEPKVSAACNFVKAGGKAIITSQSKCVDAIQGKAGTRIIA